MLAVHGRRGQTVGGQIQAVGRTGADLRRSGVSVTLTRGLGLEQHFDRTVGVGLEHQDGL